MAVSSRKPMRTQPKESWKPRVHTISPLEQKVKKLQLKPAKLMVRLEEKLPEYMASAKRQDICMKSSDLKYCRNMNMMGTTRLKETIEKIVPGIEQLGTTLFIVVLYFTVNQIIEGAQGYAKRLKPISGAQSEDTLTISPSRETFMTAALLYINIQTLSHFIRCPQAYRKVLDNQIDKYSHASLSKQLMKNQETGKGQKVLEDHQCSICLSVFYKPLRLVKCKHIFCQNCLTEAALIVQNQRCPLCRTAFLQSEVLPENQFWNELQARYPNSIRQKKKIIKERVLARFLVGNTTQFLETNEDNKYRWTLFVKPAPGDDKLSKNIKRIDLKLHPTFNPSTISYPITENRSVELSRIGWGTFRIEIEIYWKDHFQQTKSEIYHDLEFQPLVERVVHTTLTLK